MQHARAGDAEAFGQLLKQQAADLSRTIARELPARWQAVLAVEDVLQATFTEAYCARTQCLADDAAAFAAWLRRIALHNLRDAIRALEADKRGGERRRVTSAAVQGDSTDSLLEALFGTDSRTPSRAAMRSEAVVALRNALAQLPEHYRQAVELYDLQELSIEEVAAHLKKSPGAVHLLRLRAHGRLRELLAGSRADFRSRA